MNKTQVLTGDQITQYRARVLQKALWLELKGMQRRGQSAYSIIKQEFGLKGNKQSVHDQLKEMLDGQ
jgi:hypothetical protein